MVKAVVFGGTTEGRVIAGKMDALRIPSLLCVATAYGEALPRGSGHIALHTGRMDAAAMRALLKRERPALVMDATHPYAEEASRNIRTACEGLSLQYIRVLREEAAAEGGMRFQSLPALVEWLHTTAGNIFVSMGAKHAGAFTEVSDFAGRVYIRLLPALEGLTHCLELGYPPAHLILMQGPFSKELNLAMFRQTGAQILVTKESGPAGGYGEKIEAARELGMRIAVLARPKERGIALAEACALLEEQFS